MPLLIRKYTRKTLFKITNTNMWHLEFGKLYFFLLGIWIPPSGRVQKMSKKMILYTTICVLSVFLALIAGFGILSVEEHVCDSPWAILHTINYSINLMGEFAGMVVIISQRRAITSMFMVASCVQNYVKDKFQRSNSH